MIYTFINIIVHHFQSAGFKRRLHAIYLPAFKVGISYLYRIAHARLERYTRKIEAGVIIEDTEQAIPDGAGAPDLGSVQYLTFEEAYAEMQKYLISHEPQVFGQCCAHTMKNLHRFAMKTITGKAPQLCEADVYLDRETRQWGNDAGMYPDTTITRIVEKGIAVDGIVPTITTTEGLALTREAFPDAKIQPFRLKALKGKTNILCKYDADIFYTTLAQNYWSKGTRAHQVSIDSMGGWWSGDVPTAGGVNYGGGHSIVVVNIPFKWGNDRAVFAIDSSYLAGGVWRVGAGIRIFTETAWRSYGRELRLIDYIPEIEAVMSSKATPQKITLGAKIGDTGAHVETIQRALMSLGYSIPALKSGQAKYGNYGGQTQTAVLTFTRKQAVLIAKYDATLTPAKLEALAGKEVNMAMVQAMNYLLG